MKLFIFFVGALLVIRLATGATNWLFGRLMSARAAAIASFILWAGLAVFALSGRIAPVRTTLAFAITPLLTWFLYDLIQSGRQVCPRCGRRIRRGLLSCPRCGRDLDTGATIQS